MASNIEVKMIWFESMVKTNQNEEGINATKRNETIRRKNEGGREKQSG